MKVSDSSRIQENPVLTREQLEARILDLEKQAESDSSAAGVHIVSISITIATIVTMASLFFKT